MTARDFSVSDQLRELPFATNAAISPGKIKSAIVTTRKPLSSASGPRSVDITGAISEFYFYESVLSNTFSATLMLVDTGYILPPGSDKIEKKAPKTIDGLQSTSGILNELNITGGERIDFEVEDNNIAFGPGNIKISGGMYINRVRDLTNQGLKDVYAIDLVPGEFISNELTRVTGRYDGPIDLSVATILNDVLGIYNDVGSKPLDFIFDRTMYDYNFIGNNRKPLYVCTWLASKSSPSITSNSNQSMDGHSAGFLFYQTRNAFNFRSIDSLAKESKENPIIRHFVYNNTGKQTYHTNKEQYTDENNIMEENILAYTVKKTVDLGKDLALGTYNNRTVFFDFYSMNYKFIKYSVKEDRLNTLGPNMNLPDEAVRSSPSRYMSRILDVGSLPNGVSSDDQLANWRANKSNPNFQADKIMVQSIMRYNQLFSVRTRITIPGDFKLKAGDLVDCTFQDLSNTKEENLELSGKYIVAKICHRITPNDTFSSLELVKDSMGSVVDKYIESSLKQLGSKLR